MDIRLDLAGDVELVAVEGDTLEVGDQILLGARLGTLVSDGSGGLNDYFLTNSN